MSTVNMFALVALIGLGAWILSPNQKLAEAGRLVFIAGLVGVVCSLLARSRGAFFR